MAHSVAVYGSAQCDRRRLRAYSVRQNFGPIVRCHGPMFTMSCCAFRRYCQEIAKLPAIVPEMLKFSGSQTFEGQAPKFLTRLLKSGSPWNMRQSNVTISPATTEIRRRQTFDLNDSSKIWWAARRPQLPDGLTSAARYKSCLWTLNIGDGITNLHLWWAVCAPSDHIQPLQPLSVGVEMCRLRRRHF